jgi:glycosyltransferase involved in cell wall biosynthesis
VKVALSLLAFRPGLVGGAETYVRALVRELPAAAGEDAIAAIMDRDLAGRLDTPGMERVVVDRTAREIVALRLLEAFTPYRARDVERAFERTGADVALFPQQSIFPKKVDLPSALTIHDVQHLFHPENFGLADRAFRAAIYPYSMARAARLFANSQWTRRTLVERCGVEAERVAVTPLGFTGDATPVEPYRGIGGSYLYYPAATFAHKGHETLLRSYAALRRRGEMEHKLVLTGQKTPLWRRLSRLAGELGVAGDVVHLGFVPYPDVRRLYAGAAAVVFPTRFEGFGMPVVEATELGKKVVVSRLEVFSELGVPGEWQIDFRDPGQLLGALRRDGATVLARRPWTWAETAAATMAELRAIAP